MSKISIEPFSQISRALVDLFEETLGPGRFARTAYRLRENGSSDKGFGLNAFCEGQLVGTISMTPIAIGGNCGACLIGPLVVSKEQRGQRLGLSLIEEGILLAKEKKMKVALLVGDAAYYEKAQFYHVDPHKIVMPGPVNLQRLLGREIVKDALQDFQGVVTAL